MNNPYKNGQIMLSGRIDLLQIKNNIFYQTKSAALEFYAPSITNTTVSNNIVSDYPMFTANVTGIEYSSNLERTNPLLVSPDAFNFMLQNSSPAVNKGLQLSDVTVDFNGVSRPQGSGYDMGAFELGTVTIPSVSPTPVVCLGDGNGDKRVDLSDYSMLVANFLKTGPNSVDFNKDNIVDLSDYTILVSRFLKPC